jgi:hypothetical protein
LIGKARRDELKKFLRDMRQCTLDPQMLEYTLELLNVSDYEAEWDWGHVERTELLHFEDEPD